MDVARCRSNEHAREPTGARRVDLAAHRAVLVGEEGHHRCDELRRHRRRVGRIGGLAGHARHRRGRDEVDLDAVSGSCGREAARQADDGSLGGGVGEIGGESEHPSGSGHDDTAVALFDHVRPCRAGGVERAADMHVEVSREVVRVGLRKAGPSDDAGIVDHDVEAPELLDRRIDERLCAGSVGHVAVVGDRSSASGDDLGGDGGRRCGVHSNAQH